MHLERFFGIVVTCILLESGRCDRFIVVKLLGSIDKNLDKGPGKPQIGFDYSDAGENITKLQDCALSENRGLCADLEKKVGPEATQKEGYGGGKSETNEENTTPSYKENFTTNKNLVESSKEKSDQSSKEVETESEENQSETTVKNTTERNQKKEIANEEHNQKQISKKFFKRWPKFQKRPVGFYSAKYPYKRPQNFGYQPSMPNFNININNQANANSNTFQPKGGQRGQKRRPQYIVNVIPKRGKVFRTFVPPKFLF